MAKWMPVVAFFPAELLDGFCEMLLVPASSKIVVSLSTAEPISHKSCLGENLLWSSIYIERERVRMHGRNSPADSQMEDIFQTLEVLLQTMLKITVRQAAPLQPMENPVLNR